MVRNVELRACRTDELSFFSTLEKQAHAEPFINATSMRVHLTNFADPRFRYLTIELPGESIAGYLILVREPHETSVEFRRIVVDSKHRGVGQIAIAKMECFCQQELNASRIWLDVYEDNVIGRHIYEKLHYSRFKSEQRGSRTLHFYEKFLNSAGSGA